MFTIFRSFQDEEFYICIHSLRGIDEVLFTTEGGVEIGDVEAKAKILKIDVAADGVSDQEIKDALLDQVPDARKEWVQLTFWIWYLMSDCKKVATLYHLDQCCQ